MCEAETAAGVLPAARHNVVSQTKCCAAGGGGGLDGQWLCTH